MSIAGNAPTTVVHIRAAARKSFAFSVWIKDYHGTALDITDTSIRLVVKKPPVFDDNDSSNLITNNTATLAFPTKGYARFSLQASDLDHDPGEYQFTLVLLDRGYSSILAQGIFEILENTEANSTESEYIEDDASPVTALEILLRGRNVVSVRTGPVLPPGTTSFTVADKGRLDSMEDGAQANVSPDWNSEGSEPGAILNKPNLGSAAFVNVEDVSLPLGGFPGEVLAKRTGANYDVMWVQAASGGGGGIDPTAVPDGFVPTANGVDGWTWEPPFQGVVSSVNGASGVVELGLDDIHDGTAMQRTTIEQVEAYDILVSDAWTALANRPTLGTAAETNAADYYKKIDKVPAADVTGVLANTQVPKVSGLRGFLSGTAEPTSGLGADGDLYLQFLE